MISPATDIHKPKHFLSVDDLSNDEYEKIFARAKHIKDAWQNGAEEIMARRIIVALLFTEPSTRTSMSFDKAAQALGFRTSSLNMVSSSIAKGESYPDTVMMAALGAHVLVARHGGEKGTLADIVQNVFPLHPELSKVAVINAGEGTGEHPTQALLDLFTIWEHFGRTDVHIGFYGDLAHGRTCHSLIKLAARFGATFSCIAPNLAQSQPQHFLAKFAERIGIKSTHKIADDALQMPKEYLDEAAKYGQTPVCTNDIKDVIGKLDVLYVTRLQLERLPHELHHRFDQQQSGYKVTSDLLQLLPETSILMHPLPRLDEMPKEECDDDPRAVYVRQANNGIYTRAALLEHVLGMGPT